MCEIQVLEQGESKLQVVSPYNPELPTAARALGGKLNGKAWEFDQRLADDVAELYRRIYGEWPGDATDYVKVRATALKDIAEDKAGIFLFGRCLARAYSRDSGAKLGDGVILREGRFRSGGSAKYWKTVCEEGTVVELFDVPRKIAEQARSEEPLWKVEILGDSPSIGRDALIAERGTLLARIAQIDALLEEIGG